MDATCRTGVPLCDNKEYRQLRQQHQELEIRLRTLCRRRILGAGEELETRRLKKRKLILKDRMAAIAQEHSNSGKLPT